jgi:protein-L-isoaspartate(D-aspartate) O-methyltransferase
MISAAARMIEEQLVARGIRDQRLLQAFRRVPRHRFVPPELSAQAYDDTPLPIGCGQTISQPYIVAYMTEALGVQRTDRILEIGTGSGYQTALLAEMGGSVFTIERIPELANRARRTLIDVGYRTITFMTADGTTGWPAAAPFDCILAAAAAPAVPEPLLQQLAENARLIIPIADDSGQTLVLITRARGNYQSTALAPVRFVPLIGAHAYPAPS